MNIFSRVFSVLLLSTSIPALAAWETHQSDGIAQTSYIGERYQLTISCTSRSNLELTLEDRNSSGDQYNGIQGLMMWVKIPDGRTDRWPVSVTRDGSSLTGALFVSDFNLDFFQKGQSFRLDAPVTGFVFLEGDMIGTGAARFAFDEQCEL